MSYLVAAPEMLAAAAADLAGIGSTLTAANVVASIPTTTVSAAGLDGHSAADVTAADLAAARESVRPGR